jgi:iron complex outermembrane receptor protein
LARTSARTGVPTSWAAPDLNAFAKLFNIYSGRACSSSAAPATPMRAATSAASRRRTSAAYAQLDFNGDRFAWPIRGDIGVRYVKTEQSSTGYQLVAGAAQQATIDRDYDDILPALNLTAEVTPDFLLRFGAAKVMTRPTWAA